MDILKNFGVDPVLLGAQIINFLIIFYLLKKFLYKPVIDMLKRREDKIKEGLKQAEEARLTLEKTIDEEKKILTRAQSEAKKIVDDSKILALEISKNIEEDSKKQAERILSEAREQILEEAKETEQKLSESVTVLAKDILTKSLEGFLGEKEQKQVTNKLIKQLNK